MVAMSLTALFSAGIAGSLFALSQLPPEAPGAGPVPGPVHFDNYGQMILAGITILAGAFNLWMTWRKDQAALKRAMLERQWQIEDREAVAKTLATKTEQTAGLIVGRIEENTELTKKAADASAMAAREANHVNLKIAAIGSVRQSEPPRTEKTRSTDQTEEEKIDA